MTVRTWLDTEGNTFSEPYIPSNIVGFHGIDPDLVGGGGSGSSAGTDIIDTDAFKAAVDARIEAYNNKSRTIDCGEITSN